MARTCVFCRASGVTKEHVLPTWLSEMYPKGMFTTIGTDGSRRQSKDFGVIVRHVCGTCNYGWLSGMENEAKPIIGRMVSSLESIVLGPDQRAAVALWAAKVAVLYRYTYKPPLLAPRSTLDYIYRERKPPPWLHIYLAAYSGHAEAVGQRDAFRIALQRPNSPEIHYADCLTVRIDHLVIQTLEAPEHLRGARPHSPQDDRRYFLTAWPPTTRTRLVWPPPLVLSDDDMPRFTHRLITVNRQPL